MSLLVKDVGCCLLCTIKSGIANLKAGAQNGYLHARTQNNIPVCIAYMCIAYSFVHINVAASSGISNR